MRIICCLFYLLIISQLTVFAQDSIQARIVLIGDAGDFHNGKHPVIDAVKQTTKFDQKTTILYLGDNLYLTGLPDAQTKGYNAARAVIDTQAFIARGTDAQVLFIPGNHDWNRGHTGGWEAVVREGRYINFLGEKNVRFYPQDGCGGPEVVNVSNDVIMLLFDSEWWINSTEKPGVESDCPYKTKEEILAQMTDILDRNLNKLVIIACHHPFKSYGTHGGYFTWKQYVFPLTEMYPKLYVPIPFGFIYPIARGVFGTPQDLAHPAYANMIKEVQTVTKNHPNVIFVAGHEHNLQYIKDSSHHYIISGAGTKSTRVSKNKKAPFTTSTNGFAVLEVSKNKNVDVSFFTVKDSISRPFKDHVLNFSKIETAKPDSSKVVAVPTTAFKDSVEVVVNSKYDTASKLHRYILGENYREDWAASVNMKVFNINKERGGFTIKSLGGGKQTKSLRLTDKEGNSWVLRMVNKDPEQAIPEVLRGSLAQRIVNDMISAANPFAPLTIPTLAKALGVVAPSPELFFVPNDPALGVYKDLFSNTVCMLEQREPGSRPDSTKSTAKVLDKLKDDNDNHVQQQTVLTARLLDMLVGDWDRHADQWRFGSIDTGKGKLYYAIPRDRDQAFFNSDGLLLKVVSQNLMPYLRGFKTNLKRTKWLNWEARDFDRLFMNDLGEDEWRAILANFKVRLTDEVITDAVKKLPADVFAIRGQEIINKLKARRDKLAEIEGMKYYNFLAKQVNVLGSDKREYFKVSEGDGGGLHVKVFKRNARGDTAAVMFDRVFKEGQTKEVRLYGLGRDDIFDVADGVKSKIDLRIIGGPGNDTFDIKGKIPNSIYDLRSEKNFIANSKRSKNKMGDYPSVNEYDFANYQYNINRFPRLNIGFNAEDKLMVGVGILRRTYGFRKEPFATQQRLTTLYAPSHGAYQFKYNGEFNHVVGTTDLVLNAEMVHPTFNNFFGLGNATINDRDREFYRVRYNYVAGDVLLRRRLGAVIQFLVGPTFYNYWNRPDDNQNKILSVPQLYGLDSARVYSTKTYAGGKLALVINNVNNELFPTRGIYWNTTFTQMAGLNKQSNNLSSLTSDVTLYSSLSDPAKVVAVLRGGGGKIYNENFEYFQALNLGANNYLRGFRKNRFSGSSVAYMSAELRVKLFDSKSYILPGAVGVIGFEEMGKVWVRNEISNRWHNSAGGGLYFTPYNLLLVSGTVAFSREETLFNFSIGTKFNLTF